MHKYSQPEHIHCLFHLRPDMSLSKALNLIKGESSYWISKNRIIMSHFKWADEYYASSVSEPQLNKVRNYIINQDGTLTREQTQNTPKP